MKNGELLWLFGLGALFLMLMPKETVIPSDEPLKNPLPEGFGEEP